MEAKQVRALLQKFYDGATTPEEEKRLTTYFSGRSVPEEFLADQEVFLSLHLYSIDNIEIPEDLESHITSSLEQVQHSRGSTRTRLRYAISSAAAVILILVSTLLIMNRKEQLGTYNDPQLAYAETKETLDLVAKYLQMGTGKLQNLGKYSDAIQPLKNLDLFEKGIQKSSGILGTTK